MAIATQKPGPSADAFPVNRLLFIGKRFYTNKDALLERFGRIHHLPREWSRSIPSLRCWLVDYHTRQDVRNGDDALSTDSAPALSLSTLRLFAEACLKFRPQVVVASGDCYIGLLGWLIARLCGARLVFDIYDKYDDFGGYVRPLGFDLFGFLKRSADVRLFASRALAKICAVDLLRGRDLLVPNGVDAAEFRPLDRVDCRRRLDLPGSALIVGYFGAMEPDRGVADLVAAVERLRVKRPDLLMLVCGRRHPQTSLDREWIIYRGMVPHREMPYYINSCDAVAVPYRRSSFMDMGASCKAIEYLMCGVPVVSSRTPNFVDNYPDQAAQLGQGLFECGDVDDLVRALDFQLGASVRVTAPAACSWPNIAAAALAEVRIALRAASHPTPEAQP